MVNAVKKELQGDYIAPQPTNSPGPQPQPQTTKNPNNADCPNGDGFYADVASNCKDYYLCIYQGSSKMKYSCPQGLLFDMNSKSCNFPNAVTCN